MLHVICSPKLGTARSKVRGALSHFLSLLDIGGGSEAENIRIREPALGHLAFVAHAIDDKRFRALARERFASVGDSNLPISITHSRMETNLMLGNARDELADIACDLAAADALGPSRSGFEHHGGAHLCSL